MAKNRNTDRVLHSRLLELMRYNPEDGNFYNLVERNMKWLGKIIAGGVRSGRMVIGIENQVYLRSRLAWFYMTGSWPEKEIDHINRDKMDDRWCNLREANRNQNLANTLRNNKCGFKGVHFDKKKNRFRAEIRINGKKIVLGTFLTAEEAGEAYRKAAIFYHGEFARF